MQRNTNTIVKRRSAITNAGVIATNSVLKNTYMLLSITLLFSAATAFLATITRASFIGLGPLLLINFGLIYLVNTLKNSAWGILAVFLFTGFFGYTLGPVINLILTQYTNGAEILITSLGLTGIVFFGLSCYVMTTKKDFSYLGGFLLAGVTIAIIASLIAAITNLPMLQLITSGVFALLASGLILWETSQIINGGETNYIIATISLYVQLYNLFISLLNILLAFAGKQRN